MAKGVYDMLNTVQSSKRLNKPLVDSDLHRFRDMFRTRFPKYLPPREKTEQELFVERREELVAKAVPVGKLIRLIGAVKSGTYLLLETNRFTGILEVIGETGKRRVRLVLVLSGYSNIQFGTSIETRLIGVRANRELERNKLYLYRILRDIYRANK